MGAALVDVIDDDVEALAARQLAEEALGIGDLDGGAERVERELAPRHGQDLRIEVDADDLCLRAESANDTDDRAAADPEQQHAWCAARNEEHRRREQVPAAAGHCDAGLPYRRARAVDVEELPLARALYAHVRLGVGLTSGHGAGVARIRGRSHAPARYASRTAFAHGWCAW